MCKHPRRKHMCTLRVWIVEKHVAGILGVLFCPKFCPCVPISTNNKIVLARVWPQNYYAIKKFARYLNAQGIYRFSDSWRLGHVGIDCRVALYSTADAENISLSASAYNAERLRRGIKLARRPLIRPSSLQHLCKLLLLRLESSAVNRSAKLLTSETCDIAICVGHTTT